MTTTVRPIPIVEGLFTLEPEPRLLGSRCGECGTAFFPRRAFCRNPRCSRTKPEDIVLSPRGTLYSFTVQHYMPPPPSRIDPSLLPYTVTLVDLPEGVRVMGMLAEDARPEGLTVGMTMELTTGLLFRDDDGAERATWKFRPVADTGSKEHGS